MTRRQKVKSWFRSNKDEIVIVTTLVLFATVATAAEVYNRKQLEKDTEEFEKFVRDQNRQGRTVYQLANGSFIGVPA